MNRLIEKTVFSGLTAAWRRARLPTRRSPDLVKATTDGVVREPSELGITTGSPPSMTAMTELVVPRSIPTVFGICPFSSRCAVQREFEFLFVCLSPARSHQNRLEGPLGFYRADLRDRPRRPYSGGRRRPARAAPVLPPGRRIREPADPLM